MYPRITCDPVADSLGSAEHILQNHCTTRIRKSKDNRRLKLAILSDVLRWAVKRVVLYLQQVKLSSAGHIEINLKVIHLHFISMKLILKISCR